MTKTADARHVVGIPPRITLRVLRDGYVWHTPLGGSCLVEYDKHAQRWEWEVGDGGPCLQRGTAKFLHRALTHLHNADLTRVHVARESVRMILEESDRGEPLAQDFADTYGWSDLTPTEAAAVGSLMGFAPLSDMDPF